MTSEPLLRPSVRGPARGTRSPGSVSGACRPVPRSPRPPPLAPSAPHPLARACSPASQLLRQGLTSPARASPASAHRLPDADHTATGLWSSGRSPGSRARSVRTCQGLRPRGAGRLLALTQATVWPSASQTASALRSKAFAAQWLAYTIPCRRFAPGLATENARLGADAVRYSFIAVDFHHLLLAGLPAHPTPFSAFSRRRRMDGRLPQARALLQRSVLVAIVRSRRRRAVVGERSVGPFPHRNEEQRDPAGQGTGQHGGACHIRAPRAAIRGRREDHHMRIP